MKRLLKLQEEFKSNQSIDSVVNSYKPSIFWKEKEIVKRQMKILSYDKIFKLIIGANKIEYLIKKNPTISINIITDFILENCVKT